MEQIAQYIRCDSAVQPQILVMEDESSVAQGLEMILREQGYGVDLAMTGQGALDSLSGKGFDLLVADLRLPDMDGMEVIKRVKSESPETEVVVITGYAGVSSAVDAMKGGVADYLPKPFTEEEFMAAVEEALSENRKLLGKEDIETAEAGEKKLIQKKEVVRALKKVSKNDRAFLPGIGWAEVRYPNRGGHAAPVQERLGGTSGESLNYFSFQNNLIENSIEGVLACNKEGLVVIFNKTLEKMLGYSQSEVCSKMLFSQFFHAEDLDKFREKLYGEEYGGKNQLPLFETSLINKAGDSVPVQISAKVMFVDDEDIGFATFFRHPTETGRLEQKPEDQARLLQQHKLISLGRLAASVVHEINNPLAGILNYLGLMIKILGREPPLDAENLTKFGRYLDLVEGEVRRCSIIMSNLLAFSRKSNLEFNEVDIDELLERCIILSQHKLDLQNIEIRKRTDSEVPKVWGDFNQIQQCVINLIFNAIDAMPDGGTLILESSFNREKGIVRIGVQDTGYGIPKEHLTHIFDPFYTTKAEGEGFGLGLSTVHGIIERHKGSINLKTEVGEGTIFTIDLPVARMGTQD